MKLHSILLLVSRGLCSLVLSFAGIMKVASPETAPAGAEHVTEWMHAIGLLVAIVEVGLALLLISPMARWRRRSAAVAAMVVATGCAYLIWLRIAGLPIIRCGCFGGALRLNLATHLVLNGVLLGLLCLLVGVDRESRAPVKVH